jgi:hypothetical protein
VSDDDLVIGDLPGILCFPCSLLLLLAPAPCSCSLLLLLAPAPCSCSLPCRQPALDESQLKCESWSVLPHERLYLEHLPEGDRYYKSFMHRDTINFVTMTK